MMSPLLGGSGERAGMLCTYGPAVVSRVQADSGRHTDHLRQGARRVATVGRPSVNRSALAGQMHRETLTEPAVWGNTLFSVSGRLSSAATPSPLGYSGGRVCNPLRRKSTLTE